MLKAPYPQQYQFETITLDELVPEDHLVRKIDAAIDFEFIREAVAHFYRPYNGRESWVSLSLGHYRPRIEAVRMTIGRDLLQQNSFL